MLRFASALLLWTTMSVMVTAQDFNTALEERSELRDAILEEAVILERQLNHLKQVIRYVRPSVVHVETTTASEPGYASSSQVDEAGSGVLFEHDGRYFVLTNRHVIKQSPIDRIRIFLEDGRTIRAVKMMADRETDVAVIQVEADNLIPATIGDSSKITVGDTVIAIGSPFGLSQSVSRGIISAVGRRNLQLGRQGLKLQNFFQTDAAINPGNSGGPLINLRGEVIGLNTAIASNSGGSDGIGFAIPIHSALAVAGQLAETGQVSRAFFGVRMDADFDANVAAKIGLYRARGARVSGTTPGSPADLAGVKPGDVITKFYHQEVEDDLQLINIVSLCPLDQEIPFVIYRDGKFLKMTIKLAVRKGFES